MTPPDGPHLNGRPKANVLLVDDRAENLLALEAALQPLEQNLVRATSGAEALKQLLTRDFAVILLDVQMPGMDGFQVASLIKGRDRTRNVPIVFITAISREQEAVSRGYTVGAVDYILKPFDQHVLRSKVQVFVELYLKEAALQESEERFRKAFEDAPIGIGLASTEGRWLRVNHALCEITGYSEEELLAGTLQELEHPDDRSAGSHHLRQVLAGETRSYQLEKRYLHATGKVVWVLKSVSVVRDGEGGSLYLVVQLEDITERKRAEGELTHQALHDSLTGLANRALFLDRVELAIRRLERYPSQIAVLFLDLDRFKVINDSLGHDCGDELLQAVGQRLVGVLRPTDTVARFGGDEFTILCEEVDGERGAVAVAERIAAAMAVPFEVRGDEAFVTTSIGIVVASDPGAEAADLIRDADAAMYRAKENGKARYELFDDRMRARAMERLATENALRRAVDRSELSIFYQPEVNLDTGRVFGVEALLRWMHPSRGVVLPRDFVPLAEETGLIVPMGRWVLEEACRQLRAWRETYEVDPPLSLAVNLSARQFAQPDLVELVERALAGAEMDPSLLCLEITETVLMEDSEHTLKVLGGLKRLGVKIAIDDFGTGYSSLAYLKRFDVDILKVDRSFVDGLGRDPHSCPVLSAVVSLSQALGLVAIAEGVETEAQLAELRGLGFEYAQGYHFGGPRPVPAVEDLIAGRSLGGALGDPRTNGAGNAPALPDDPTGTGEREANA